MIKKLFLLIAVLALLVTKTATAAEIYAVLSSDEKTLTFYYDNLRNSRSGTVYDYEYNEKNYPEWHDCHETVTKAIFDQSMTSARPTDCSRWFSGFENLVQIENLRYLDTRIVTDMNNMFYNCASLTSLDVSNFDTRNVTDMKEMFNYCEGLSTIDVSSFNTENVTNMTAMFMGMKKLTYLDLSGFNTQKVQNMMAMFNSCYNLANINLRSFDTRNVIYMDQMFDNCRSLTYINLSGFTTPKVEQMVCMFEGCGSLYAVDLTKFSVQSARVVREMFSGCSQLRTIYCDNDWSTNTGINDNDMFKNCTSLIGSCGTRYSENGGGIAYARPDAPGNPGYFTLSTARVGLYVGEDIVYSNVPSKYVTSTEPGQETIANYDSEAGVLYLKNAKIDTNGEGIFAPSGMEIRLIGENHIIANGNAITSLGEIHVTEELPSTLTIHSTNGYGVSIEEGFYVEHSTPEYIPEVNIYGKLGAVDGGRPLIDNMGREVYGAMDTNDALITLSSDGEHPVLHNISTIWYSNGNFLLNYNYTFDYPKHTVVDNYTQEPVTKPFKLVPLNKIRYYNTRLGGHYINNYNYDDFNPMSLESGKVTYDHATHTLTMQDAKFVEYETEWESGLEVSNYTDFTLKLKGDNSIVGNDESSIYGIEFNEGDADETVKRHWRIEGVTTGGKPATLRVKGQIYFESTENEADVTFKNVDIVCEDLAYMWSQDYVDVTIDNCMFDLWNYEDKTDFTSGIVESLQSLTLVDCQFENGCRWDAERSAVLNSSGKPEQKHVKIARGGATWQRGDVNRDGNINSADVQKTYQLMAQGATGANHPEADVNGDGNVNSADIQKIYGIMAEQ